MIRLLYIPHERIRAVAAQWYSCGIWEKIKLIEILNDEEKKMIFSFVDALVGKKKLKDALSGVLNDVK